MKSYLLPALIAIPLVIMALAGSSAGSYFANVASAQYGADRVAVCLPISSSRVESYAVVTVPAFVADRFLDRPGAVLADENGECPGVPLENLADVLALSIIDRVIDRLADNGTASFL